MLSTGWLIDLDQGQTVSSAVGFVRHHEFDRERIVSELRNTNLDQLDGGHFDALIVGGGINGAVSAAALAGRGASVALVDAGDFAGVTSQASSNLVWGGFKYLENYSLRLVRKLCSGRNRLMAAYPANIAEIGFLAALGSTSPHPPWLASTGSFAYWAIGGFKTAAPRPLSSRSIGRREPVVDLRDVSGGIEYYDAILGDNDSRFVFGFVRAAMDFGATAANYVELTGAERAGGTWRAELHEVESGRTLTASARVLVNAAGPYLGEVNRTLRVKTAHRIVHSKGIHLVVDQLTPNHRVLAFFDDTRRLFYVIPMGRRSVIGTTDTRVDDPSVGVTDEDRHFLLDQINARLDLPHPLTGSDIIAERCGTRPLVVAGADDQIDQEWTSLSRKHVVEVDRSQAVVSILGGKLTDCLNVGEEVAAAAAELGLALEADHGQWFGEPPDSVRLDFYRQTRGMGLDTMRDKPGVEPLSDRLWRRYGRRAFDLIDDIRKDPALAEDIMDAADYLRAEVYHTAENEMVVRLDDFLRRRSKISLVVPEAEVRASAGLVDVAQVLFGDQHQEKLDEYWDQFGTSPGPS